MNKPITSNLLDITELPDELSPVLSYWRELTPAGTIGPQRQDFELIKIPGKFLPYAILTYLGDAPEKYRYRYWGSRLADIFHKDHTGDYFADLPDRFRDFSISTYSHIAQSAAPAFYELVVSDDADKARFQKALRLPLSEDGITVTHVFSILLFPWLFEKETVAA